MKWILLAALLIPGQAFAQETCDMECQTIEQDVNTPVPIPLKDGTIMIKTKDGKEYTVSANSFKVVPRKQQFKVTKQVATKVIKVVEKKPEEKKNVILLGISRDYTDMDVKTSPGKALLYSVKGPILDFSYMRRQVFKTDFDLGIGLNTNMAPRAFLGYEF